MRRLSRGKYIILCESLGQRALNGRASLSDGILSNGICYASYGMCFVMVTVRLGYSRLCKA